MIKNYNAYLLENMMFDHHTIIDILKSLKNTNNDTLINKILNNTGKIDKSLLMSIVENNDESLVDFILQFNVDINHKNKYGENVLFYCKSANIANKLIDAGADVHTTNKNIDRNILVQFAFKKIYDIELYKKLMSKGIDIKNVDKQQHSVLSYSITNKAMVKFLLDNNVELNGSDKFTYFSTLCGIAEYYAKKTTYFFNTLKLLLENGMTIDANVINIITKSFDVIKSTYAVLDIYDVLKVMKKYFNEKSIIELWKKYQSDYYHIIEEITKNLIRLFESPALYDLAKRYWASSNFNEKFADIIKEFPYFDDANKYNL